MAQILTINDTMMCPHGGTVTLVSTQIQCKADQGLILRPSDVFVVAGCPFMVALAPHPCLTVEWQNESHKCKAGGAGALTTSSMGMCKAGDQAPQGTVLIVKTQMKASAQ